MDHFWGSRSLGRARPHTPIAHRKILIGALATALALATPALSTAIHAQADEINLPLTSQALRAAGIVTAQPDLDVAGQDLSFPGQVVIPPQQASVVPSPAAGLVEQLLVAQDESVKAGVPIARMRSPQVVEAQHLLLAALTDERLAADKVRRTEALFAVRAMSEVQLILARGELAHAQARVDERTQLLKLMGVKPQDVDRLRKTRQIENGIEIVAPVDGIVVSRSVTQGARVDAATPLFTIATLSPLWVNIQVPTFRIGALQVGSPVVIPAHGARGRIIRIGTTIDPTTQSVGVVAEIDTNGGSVRPGLAVTVNVRLDARDADRWSLPIASVIRHRGQSWVFIQTPEGFRARPVEVLAEAAQRVSVRAPLRASDRIATQGVMTLAAELAENDGR